MTLRGITMGLFATVLFAGTIAVLVAAFAEPRVQRFGQIIGLKPEKVEEYKKLHAAVWPSVLKKIKDCHIRNYSIFLKEVEKGKFYLFAYFEYTGIDFQADMAGMAADPETQRWWKETDPCQQSIPLKGDQDWWSAMPEVFHTD